MTLVLEVEYLSGLSFSAVAPDSDQPDWPPQPDRIFSALTAAWALRGEGDSERRALEWLEAQPAPRILASPAEPRTAPVVFVPPNDPRSGRKKAAAGVLPARRSRQPRRFPATLPHDPVLRFFWSGAEPENETLAALQSLALDTAYIGHSASLTRCRFLCASETPEEAGEPRRQVYPGRLKELRRNFESGERPLPGERVSPLTEPAEEPARSVFGARWLLLEYVDGTMPDVRCAALVAKRLRDTLLGGYRRIGLEDSVPELVSGHAPDGSPSRLPHLAIAALPDIGRRYADGQVKGFALIPPRDSSLLRDDDFLRALRKLAPLVERHGRRILALSTKEGTQRGDAFRIDLSPTLEPPSNLRSLDPDRYVGAAQTYATVTPIALDRHLKLKGEARQQECAALIASACRNIGLPEPEAVAVDKHSAHEGAVSAYPSGKAPRWSRWRLPKSLSGRQLTHAVIHFSEPVGGPVILGAGRFLGLGLCRALDSGRR